MTDALPSIADATLATTNFSGLSLKMGSSGNIDKTAEDFESMFATQMLQPMFEGLSVDPTFGGGHGEEVMRSFLLQEYGKIIAKGDRLGIASQLKNEMIRAQETADRKNGLSTRSAKNAYNKAASFGSSSRGSSNVAVQ